MSLTSLLDLSSLPTPFTATDNSTSVLSSSPSNTSSSTNDIAAISTSPSIPAPSTSASAWPTPAPTSGPPKLAIILGITLSVFCIMAVGVVIALIQRSKLTKKKRGAVRGLPDYTMSNGSELTPSHPALRVTPFGMPPRLPTSPRFSHTPGESMRVAVRRPDGSWAFTPPNTFHPSQGASSGAGAGLTVPAEPPGLATSSVSFVSTSVGQMEEVRYGGTEKSETDAYVPLPPAYDREQDQREREEHILRMI